MAVKRQLDVVKFRQQARLMDSADKREKREAFVNCDDMAEASGMRFGNAYQMAFEFGDAGRLEELWEELQNVQRAFDQRVIADSDLVDLYEGRISTLQAEIDSLRQAPFDPAPITNDACQGCHIRELCTAFVITLVFSFWSGYLWKMLEIEKGWHFAVMLLFILSPLITVEVKGFRKNYHWVSLEDNDIVRFIGKLYE